MRPLAALFAASLLSGCVTVAQVQVDKGPVHTHWSAMGGVRIDAPNAPAIGLHFANLGAWRGCADLGVGAVSEFCVVEQPGCSVAVLQNIPDDLAAMKALQKADPEHRAGCVLEKEKPK